MKIKYFVSALLVSLCLVFANGISVNALTIGDTKNYSAINLYVDDYETDNSIHLPGKSSLPFKFDFYYALDRFQNDSVYDALIYFQFPKEFYFANTVTIGLPNPDFTYTYEVNLVCNGVEYSLNPQDPNNTGLDTFSAVVDNEIISTLFLKFTVNGIISNSSENTIIVDNMYLHVPAFHVQVHAFTSNETSFKNKALGYLSRIFNKMGEDQEELINGYDPATGNQANTDFSNSTADLEAAEGSLFENTSYNQVDYNQFDNFFSLESVGGAILFVKSALEAMYSSLGIFGIPISIGLVLLVFTRLIGFQNFTSGGG